MSKEITESKMQQALSFAYNKAINGVAGLPNQTIVKELEDGTVLDTSCDCGFSCEVAG